MIPRKALAAALKPLLPRTWYIVDNQGTVDDVNRTVVRLKQLGITRLPQAPIGAHSVRFVITITAPNVSTQAAEDKLDDQVDDLIHALDGLNVEWTDATKVIAGDRLAYDINLTITSTKKEI